jgi:hypothetical protein
VTISSTAAFENLSYQITVLKFLCFVFFFTSTCEFHRNVSFMFNMENRAREQTVSVSGIIIDSLALSLLAAIEFTHANRAEQDQPTHQCHQFKICTVCYSVSIYFKPFHENSFVYRERWISSFYIFSIKRLTDEQHILPMV